MTSSCPLHAVKLGLLADIFPEIRSEIEATQLNGLPGLTSTNALCLWYLYNGLKGSPSVSEDKLLWEHNILKPSVARFISCSKSAKGNPDDASLKEAKSLLEDQSRYLCSELSNSDFSLASQQDETLPALEDIIVWSTLQPVLNYITTNPEFEAIEKWSSKLCSKHAAFEKTKINFKPKQFEEALIKEHERWAKLGSSCQTKLPSKVSKKNSGEKSSSFTSNQHWINSSFESQQRPTRLAPLLPEVGKRNVLITSALPYVNNIPHLGNIIGCVLSADVYSRFCRGMGYNSLYICGTDEYGTATETKALEEGVSPKEICDKYFVIHRDVYQWFNISFDFFGRTTTKYQTKISQDIFWKLDQNGFLVEESMEQLKCVACDRFLADRFVEGECPFCGYADARGDQCDACGKLIDASNLKNPRCKICSATPRLESSNHLFLNLPMLEQELGETLQTRMSKGVWTDSATNITNAWLRDGLKNRCITRDLKWGTPVPKEPFTDKVFYVWFDAPIGYISITANYCGDKWTQWWKNPSEVEMFNFMAKDNVPFHSVIFPCTLLGAKDGYGIVDSLVSVEYLNYEEGKFSKSRNVGVFGNNARDSGIPADVFRFYLLFVRPESQDSTFSWVDFAIKSNTELLNNLGNFINRALSFCFNSFKAEVQEISSLEKADEDVIDNVNKELQSYIECMEKVRIRDALSKILNVSRWGNGYIQSTQPWVLNKSPEPENKARAGAINAICVNIVHICAQMLEPFMPQTAFEIFNQMGLYASSDDQNGLPLLPKSFIRAIPTGHKINKPVPLFKKLEESEVMKLKEMYGGAQQGKSPGGNTGGGAALVGVNGKSVQELQSAITEQGDIVRKLKAAKPPDKKKISEEVEILKKLKSDFEKASNEVKEASKENNAQAANQNKAEDCMLECPYAGMSEEMLKNMCTEQGNKVRALKAAKPQNKAEISAQVEILKQLKTQLVVAMKEEEERSATYGTGPPHQNGKQLIDGDTPGDKNVKTNVTETAKQSSQQSKSPTAKSATKEERKPEVLKATVDEQNKVAETKKEEAKRVEAPLSPGSNEKKDPLSPESSCPQSASALETSFSSTTSGGSSATSATEGSAKKKKKHRNKKK